MKENKSLVNISNLTSRTIIAVLHLKSPPGHHCHDCKPTVMMCLNTYISLYHWCFSRLLNWFTFDILIWISNTDYEKKI